MRKISKNRRGNAFSSKNRRGNAFFSKNHKGNILTENIIFIVLNLVFISILIIFLFSKTENGAILEEKYAKQIALVLDAAEPGMTISLDMKDAIDIAKKENSDLGSIVSIKDNVVFVKLSEKGGYSYSFFNDLQFDGVISNYYLNQAKTGFIFVIG